MARVTAEEYAADWSSGMTGSTGRMRRGVDRVTESPGKRAVAQKQAMITNLLRSIEDGTWEAQLSKMTAEEWKGSMINKGLNRIAAGVEQAKPDQIAMAQRLLASVDAAVAVVNRTPRGSLEDNIQRAATFAREMNARRLRGPGR